VGHPNLFIYKHQIRSISEAGRKRVSPSESAEGIGSVGAGGSF
jgi:hypothetical protein